MKRALLSVLMVAVLVLVPVLLLGAVHNNHAQAVEKQRTDIVNCTNFKIGQQVRIKCTAAGIVVLDQTINLPVVSLPPVTIPGDRITIRVPLPGETTTVRAPGPTQTVTQRSQVNGPTETVTIKEPGAPGETRTVTSEPRASEPRSARPTDASTVTATASPDTPRQEPESSGTLSPGPVGDDDDTVITIPEADLNPAEAVGIGTLALFGIALLILLGMYAGYYMGYKDSSKAEAKFLKSLLGR